LKVMAEYLTTQMGAINKQISEQKYNSSKCYETLLRSKLNSVCMACSGNASDYYDTTSQRFRIKRNYCVNLVNDCAQVFNLYNKVNTVLKVSRMFRIAMSSQQTDETILQDFSLDRMLSYDACLANLTDCLKNDQKLLSVCREFNTLADVTLIKLSYNSNTDSAQINSDAAAAYASSLTSQVFLYTSIVNNVNTNIQAYGNTAGIQSKMGTLTTTMGSLVTQENNYATSDNQLRTSLSLNVAQRTTRKTSLNLILPLRNSMYTNVAAISKQILTDYTTELSDLTPTDFEIKKDFFLKLQRLYSLISEAQNQYTLLSQLLTTFTPYESSLTSSTPTGTQDLSQDLTYFMTYSNFTSVHSLVVSEYTNLKNMLQSYSEDQVNRLTTLNSANSAYKSIVTQVSNRLQPQLTIDAHNLQIAYLNSNITLETFRKTYLANYQTDLGTLKTSYTTLAGNIVTNYNSLTTALTALQTSLSAVLTPISTIGSTTFYAGLTGMLTSINTLKATGGLVDTVITALNTNTMLTDPILDGQTSGYSSKLRSTISTILSEITTLSGLKSKEDLNILKAQSNLNIAYRNHQQNLFLSFAAYSKLQSISTNYSTVMASIMDSLTTRATSEAQMKADLERNNGLINLLVTPSSGTPFLPCIISPSDTACATATTAASSAQAQAAAINANLNTYLTTTWPASYATLTAQRDTYYAGMNAQLAVLQSIHLAVTGWSKNITDTLNIISASTSLISDKILELTVKTNQIYLLNSLISRYQAASLGAPTSEPMAQLIFFQETKKFLNDFSSLLTQITGNTSVTPNSYVNILTAQSTTLASLISRSTTMGAASSAKIPTITTNLDAEISWANSAVTGAASNITALNSLLSTTNTALDTAQATWNTARRRLQTQSSNEDFILSELNGADVNFQFISGVNPVIDLASADSYTPGNLTIGGNMTSNNTNSTSSIASLSCLALVTVACIHSF
jgi:hypothetical protein